MFNKLGCVSAVIIMLAPGHARAESPANGFGLFGGIVRYSMAAKPILGGSNYDSSSVGITIGFDYQFSLNDNISINPFVMSSSENTSGDLANVDSAGHGILGVQGRYWIQDQIFIGADIGIYSEGIRIRDDYSHAGGYGYGLAVGWESKFSGLIASVRYDRATVGYSNVDSDLTGIRLQVGYRWK